MAGDMAAALAAFDNRPALLAGVPPAQQPEAEQLLDELFAKLKQLELAVKTQQPDFVGVRIADSLKRIADLELLQAPGLSFSLPREYASRPYLAGRAIVQLTVEKADGSLAFVDNLNGGLSKQGTVLLTLDGYSAPISAGNFVVNVLDGLYNNKPLQMQQNQQQWHGCLRPIQASYASVITPGNSVQPRPPIPLENLPAGTFDPLYRLPLDVQSGELPVLPLSIAGAVSMTHLPDTESFLSGDEWFIYKFDKQQAGLSGLSFDEGTFGVFGYVTDGMAVVTKLQTGDTIVSAEVVSGLERLVRPEAGSNGSSS
uniref:PPIase cyclophilin-type domain-containing protein n=1 Tax=Tetradesmus obliquus TaxID=3088 RepID=A0A383V8B5_TETOB